MKGKKVYVTIVTIIVSVSSLRHVTRGIPNLKLRFL